MSRIGDGLLTLMAYLIALSIVGIVALGVVSLFLYLLFQVSSFLFGGS